MAKESFKRPSVGFYRPHDRVLATGELVNHRTGEVFTPPSMTKQSHVAECDINNILKQYKLTGIVRHISAKAEQGTYADLPDNIDFQESLNVVKRSEAAFATLPAAVRSRFNNDPAQFLEFMADPANQDEAIKLGLATRRPGEDTENGLSPGQGGSAPAAPSAGGTPPADAPPKAGNGS